MQVNHHTFMTDFDTKIYLFFWIVIWLIFWYLIAKIFFLLKIKKHRKHAVNKSSSVILWQVSEKIAPLLPEFPYNFKDLTFIGKWIDYIVFNWLSHKNLQEIVFIEIKTWKSSLNWNEKMIRDCINSGKVRYEIIRL